MAALTSGSEPEFQGDLATHYAGWAAPFRDLPDEAFNGCRWFPLSIPVNDYHSGNGVAQTAYYRTLLRWEKPVHFVWGGADDVFEESWGQEWSAQMGGTFDVIPEAGHFLQDTHGAEVASFILIRIEQE